MSYDSLDDIYEKGIEDYEYCTEIDDGKPKLRQLTGHGAGFWKLIQCHIERYINRMTVRI